MPASLDIIHKIAMARLLNDFCSFVIKINNHILIFIEIDSEMQDWCSLPYFSPRDNLSNALCSYGLLPFVEQVTRYSQILKVSNWLSVG